MKKITCLLIAMLACSFTQAEEYIIFTCEEIHGEPLGNPRPKSPIEPPTVYIENDTLMFEADHPEYVLNIKDEEDEVVYTTSVYSSVTQIILPSSLSGNYEIELIMDNWKFTGYITL